jgi:hypothetical protein
MNPSNAFAGNGITVPECDNRFALGDDPEAFLVDGIGGITTFSFTFNGAADPKELIFEETWINTDGSYIVICGLDPSISYLVKKEIINASEDNWQSFDNELLDFAPVDGDGFPVHINDIPTNFAGPELTPQPAYVTVINNNQGVPVTLTSTSNNGDGLDFEMGNDGARTSTTWATFTADEDDFIDFLTFLDGILPGCTSAASGCDGTDPNVNLRTDNMQYGLDSGNTQEEPFLLLQRPDFIRTTIGGEFLGIDTTAVLLAGAQMNAAWLIPLVLGTIGIGILVARKLNL